MSVAKRFDQFLSNIQLTSTQVTTGASHRENVIGVLNAHYYNSSSSTANSRYVGSWAKHTRIRPPRDVDVAFSLPSDVHNRFENRSGNKQSQLLQEVRSVISSSYPYTAIKGDGPVVIVPFASFTVELVPAFLLTSGKYWVAMTDNGGYYKEADYAAEESNISTSNTNSSGNCRHLIRMMKRWQGYCDVPIKSFFIELLAVDFLAVWGNSGKSSVFYDWMVRDFLSYICGRANTFVYAPGTYEMMYLGNAWLSKASTALARAKKACELETSDTAAAGDEWQKIFGTDIPKYV